jgi:5'-3' exonuclease
MCFFYIKKNYIVYYIINCMGIKGLGQFVKKYNKPIVLSDLANKTVAIDTSIYMYKFMYMSDSYEFINKFRFQIKKLLSFNIKPLYIFDGVSPELKKKLKEERKLVKTISITHEDISSLKELIKSFKLDVIISPGEGEKFCAYLNNVGYADYVLSNDYDTLLFGCKNLITYNNMKYNCISAQEVLEDLDINLKQLIDIGISSGCDYAPIGVKGLGPKKSLDISKKYPDNFFDNVTVDFDVQEIKNLFVDFSEEEKLFKSF